MQGDLARQAGDPGVVERFSSQGLSVHATSPQEFGK